MERYADLGVLASSSSDRDLTALLYNSNDTTNKTGLAVVHVNVTGLPMVGDISYVIFQIDNYHGNPYAVWKKMKSPVFPSEDQFRQLRLHQVRNITNYDCFKTRMFS